MSVPTFLKNKKKNIIGLLSTDFARRMVKVTWAMSSLDKKMKRTQHKYVSIFDKAKISLLTH